MDLSQRPFHNKRVLIFGLGLQGGGVGAAKFFAKHAREVRVTDLKTKAELQVSLSQLDGQDVSYTLSSHTHKDIEWADIILVNQDVWNKAPDSPFIEHAIKHNKQIETEIGLFFELCEAPIIGITGTRGKTTTTTATGELLQKAGFKVMVGGNIPNAGVLDRVEETQDLDYVVLELSNYQLRGLHLKQISPHIAVITSIYPDHLISYPTDTLEGSMQLYIQDKKAIYAYQDQDDILILKQQQDYFEDFATEAKAQIHYFSQDTLPEDWQLKLIGSHNRENLAAVYKLGKILEIDEKTIKQSLTNFSGVAHRLQVVVQHQGVTYINDTTATTPIAAQTALNSYPKGKIIWIAGGNSKNLPQKDLIETATERAKFIVLIDGDATPKLQKDLLKSTPAQKISPIHTSFKEAVREAKRNANFGDTILLSPGFTSFGMFKNEFDRGNQFMDIVAKLAK